MNTENTEKQDNHMGKEFITMLLRQAIQSLTFISTEDLEAHVRESRNSLNYTNSMGHILDPTGYRDALQSGQLEDARYQLEMVEHLLKVRQIVDEREAFVKKIKG